MGTIATDCLPGLVECAAPSRCARPLHRLECRSPPAQCSLPGLQHTVLDSALGQSEASGFPHSGPHGGAHLSGLGEPLRPPAVLSRNLRRSGAIPRHLLLRGQLGMAGRDDGSGKSFEQLCPEPLDQARFGISTEPPVSRTAGRVRMKSAIEFLDMDREELSQLVERARASLSAEEYRKLKGVVEALTYLTDLVADQETTIHDLRELLFPASTEKTEAVLKKAGIEGTSKPAADKPVPSQAGERKPRAPGHGRNGAEAYRNPRRVTVSHESLKHGDRCP